MLNPVLVERVAQLLSKKLTLFTRLRDYSKEQQTISYFQDESTYNNLATQKEKTIAEITKLDVVLSKYLGKDEELTDSRPDFKASCDQYNQEILSLAKEALELERLTKSKLTAELREVKSKLHQLRAGRKGAIGYIKAHRINNSGAYTSSLR